MTAEGRVHATPPGVMLGPLDQIGDGKARAYVLQLSAGRFHGFVVRRGRDVFGYVDRCPHMGLPLAQRLDDYLDPSGALILCSWHHAMFAIDDGRCIGGPCAGQRLTPWPVHLVENRILTG